MFSNVDILYSTFLILVHLIVLCLLHMKRKGKFLQCLPLSFNRTFLVVYNNAKTLHQCIYHGMFIFLVVNIFHYCECQSVIYKEGVQ